MYRRVPSAAHLAGLGLSPEDFAVPELPLWQEHWPAVRLMVAMATQWRMGPSGPVGLDYAALDRVLRSLRLADPDDAIFQDLQVLESAALDEIHAD
ncbi:hypothetical protein GT347_16095 [Xylophilus rhododendri]|uniref:DUF1799 domain-containing protein n=1 Tax=Xylophilus rhododendri TaxID=2697032 RepID=A0A857J9D3_9BURK|nr:DUF1799 domain-containing protein [Xylophilus rhododendri]QHI99365.1 hypothetical protein GT347_16095 [Xylophilus rhododendri]